MPEFPNQGSYKLNFIFFGLNLTLLSTQQISSSMPDFKLYYEFERFYYDCYDFVYIICGNK